MSTIRSTKPGFIAGLAAGAAVLSLGALIRLTLSVPTFSELVWDFVVGSLPGSLFSLAIDLLKYAAKPLLLVGLTVLQLLIAGLFGIIYAFATSSRTSLFDYSRSQPLLIGAAYGVLLWVLIAIAGILFKIGDNWLPWLGALIAFLAFGVLLAQFAIALGTPAPNQQKPVDLARRNLLFKGTAALVALSIGGVAFRVFSSVIEGGIGQVKTISSKVTSYITPNDEFYKVSKNLSDPVVDANSWHLEIAGAVSNPLKLTLNDIKSLPSVTQVTTLECISNDIGGDLIGNAVWKGVLLPDLLKMADVSPKAVDLVLRAADEYSDSIPLEEAMAPGTILAYEMNGEPLPPGHGFPLRLLVPGIYGMKNVKWITRIEAVDYDYKGYWQEQDWSDSAVVRTMSRIDTPGRWDVVSDQITITGIAFTGDRGVSEVELSFDNGLSWQRATLEKTESPYSWVLWTLGWQFASEGPHSILVRAIDGQGTVQEGMESPPFPNGASGYDKVTVTVKRPS